MADKRTRQAVILESDADVLRAREAIEHAKADLPIHAPAFNTSQALRRGTRGELHFDLMDKPRHYALPTIGTSSSSVV